TNSFVSLGFAKLDRGNWEQRLEKRLLTDGVFEIGKSDGDFVVVPREELLHDELRDRLDLRESNGVLHRKVGDNVPLRTNERLPSLVTDRDEVRTRGDLFHDKTEQVRVERSAETFVRRHENDEFTIPFLFSQKRMIFLAGIFLE